jgi:putative nucleotidyltransferase with HDIG domain
MADDVISINDVEKEDLNILLDSTYPLLQKFRESCPGTYKHSQALMSMVESISLSLGLDVQFMKVAAQYHDVGKTHNPKLFTENQLEEDGNPHDNLDPRMSYQIISRHVADGVNVLINDSKFPRRLIEVISQHHGTNVVRYFFEKSNSDIEDNYRYKCSKPTCVEAAALMICDHVEATARSKFQSGKLNPAEVIDYIITMLLDDGQLDEVFMRLGDLKKIKEALAKELEGIYQKRVDYDEAKKEKKAKPKKKEESEDTD